nr:MAG TPA: hypothetical protein [Caudoviricetes sp.]
MLKFVQVYEYSVNTEYSIDSSVNTEYNIIRLRT